MKVLHMKHINGYAWQCFAERRRGNGHADAASAVYVTPNCGCKRNRMTSNGEITVTSRHT
eukprot:scaffold2299_cov131-Cylindrotheca_fusiformis.AAC.43